MSQPRFTGDIPSRPTYATALRFIMDLKGLTQRDLARLTHKSERTISQILNGIRFMSDQDTLDFSKALHWPREFFYQKPPRTDGIIIC